MKQILFLVLLAPSCLFAQADSTRLDTLRGVTISATRLPVQARNSALAVTVLEQDRIRQAQPQLTLQESLASVPGVFVLNDANFAQDLRIAIRGFGARAAFGIRGIKLLLDDIPESAPDGQAQVDNLDLAVVDRMEVLRGTSGGLYGNASGGVLSLQTEPAPEAAIARIRLSSGSYGFRQLHASGGASLGKSAFRLALTHLGLDGYREHAALRSTLANGKWTWRPDSSARLNILLNYAGSPRADDPGALTLAQVETDRRVANPGNIRFQAGESVQQGRVGVVYEKQWAHRQRLRLRAYSTWRDFENRLPFQNGGQVRFQRWFSGGGGQYERTFDRWRLAAGFDLDRQSDDRQRYDNLDGQRGNQNLDQRETYSSAGTYALAEWKPAPDWALSAGARLDVVQLAVNDFYTADGLQSGQISYHRASPWGGVVWRFRSGLSAYANATTNFETPTLNELSNNPAGAGGFNPDLNAQRSWSLETGLRGQMPKGLAWELVLFRVFSRDELSPYELPGMPGRSFYRNAGQTLRQGLELALHWRVIQGLDVHVNYTLADFRYRQYQTPAGDFSGRRLPGLPQQWGMLECRYRHESGFFSFVQLRHTGRYYADDGNTVAIAPSVLLQGRAGYTRLFPFGRMEWFIGLDNLSGTPYFNNVRINAAAGRYYEPGAGVVVFGGVEWVWD